MGFGNAGVRSVFWALVFSVAFSTAFAPSAVALHALESDEGARAKAAEPAFGAESIAAAKALKAWNKEFRTKVSDLVEDSNYPKGGYFDCRETKEIGKAYLCQFRNRDEMNRAMVRVTMFVEGTSGHKVGDVPGWDDKATKSALKKMAGHDITGDDLMRFHTAATEACKKDESKCLSAEERAFYAKALPAARKTDGKMVVVTFAANFHPQVVASHELMHAQYFLDEKYRAVVDKFWEKEVTEGDKALVKAKFKATYDTSNDFLMKNEFQAYILQHGAEQMSLAGPLLERYQRPFRQAMRAAKVEPIQVEWEED